MPWYAVASAVPRTGREQMLYITAANKQVAAETVPGETAVYGPYLSESAAEKAHPQGSGGTVPPVAGGTTAPTINANPSNPLGALGDIGDFFHRLTEESTWTRVGEVLLGSILVYAGIRALTHGSSTVGSGARKAATKPARKVATKAAKIAVPEARLAARVGAQRIAPKTSKRVAVHRARVRKYGGKTPYQRPTPRPPIEHRVVRESHIYHHKTGKAKKP